MKFSLSTLLVILPILAAQASALAVPEGALVGRAGQGGKGGKGAQGGAAAGAGGKGKGGAAASGAANSTAAAPNSTATAAGASAAAAGGAAASNATAASNSTAAAGAGADPQSSLTLDPAVISKGFEQNGQATPEAGQVASAISSNNFINFCLTTKQPLTNGQQVKGGSCNPAPMGQIPATTAMPSAKFQFPLNNGDVGAPNTAFTIKMAIQNMETGNFVNAQANYFAAPQQLNAQGQIIGHSHVVVEKLTSITQTQPTDPTQFAFFLGLNAAAQGGVLTADVTKGLPAGAYKLSSINTAANHQPVLGPVAQHGSFDDAIYFTVGGAGGAAGGAAANSTAAAGAGAANSTAAAAGAGAANSTAAAGGKGAAAAGGKGAAAASSAAASSTAAAAGAAKGGAAGAAKGGAGAAGAATGGKGGKGKVPRFIRDRY